MGYTPSMITGFRHKGLSLLYEKGDRRRVPPEYADKLERIQSVA
ncbi:hypothetical protein [Pararhodospirillum oryzae]|nr:hypothetical protein [Pararhodospirillum oryzae]